MKKILFTCFIYITLAIQPSQASDKNWVCDDGSWNNPSCWDPAGKPLDGDDVYLSYSDLVDRIVTYANSIFPVLELDSLTVDNTGGGAMTLLQDQDTLASSTEYIGYEGTGIFTQTGGDNIANILYLGYQETGDGTYNLGETGDLSANIEIISRLGSGTFNQTGGTNEADYIAIVKCDDVECGTGTYNMSAGSLIVSNMDVASSGSFGDSGTGIFNQSGGSVTVSDRLNLADYRGASGTYNLSAGSLEAGELGLWDVDDTGVTAVFNQTGGAVTTDRVVSTFDDFTYNLEGGSLTAGDIDLQANAHFNQKGGENNVGNLYLGSLETGEASYSLSGSGKLKAGKEIISGLGSGTFDQTSGTNDANYIAISKCDEAECGFGTYNLSDGSLSVINMDVASSGSFGYGGVGVFNQSGGSVTVNNRLNLADYRGASGTYNLSAGSLEAGELGVWDVDQTSVTGVFNQTGGTVETERVVSTFDSFTYNLEGGSLTTNVIDLQVSGKFNQTGGLIDASTIKVDSDSAFNFNGGTLKVDNYTGNLINNGGTLAPGGSLGTTNINGNYTQTTDGTFEVEIGGLIQGDEYDWLNITGAATLAGTLDVSLLASGSDIFTLGEGDVFDILLAESITGEFDQLVLTALDGGLKWGVSYITDIAGEPDLVRLTINANQLPTADAGFDQVVNEGMVVDLDGSISSDSDGTVDGYNWTQTAGTAVVLRDADTATPSFVAPAVFADTVLEFSLLVTDDSGETDEVTIAVTVTDVLVVDAGADQQITEGSTVRLNGLSSLVLSRVGVSNSIVSYMWEQIEGPEILLFDSTSAKPGFIAPQVDITQLLVFKLTVTDSNGLKDSDTTFVNIRDESLTSIAPPLDIQLQDVSVQSGGFYQFNTVNDPFGANDVQWSQINGPAVTLDDSNAATPSFIAPEVTTDSAATFEVRLTDINGVVVRSFVNVNIFESTSVNLVPTADAGAEQVVTEGNTVNLDATASVSNDDENIRYYWQQTGGPMVLLSSIIESQPSFVAPAISTADDGIVLTFELTIIDESGLVSRQSVPIIILDNKITGFADEVTAIISSSGIPIGIAEIDGGSLVALEVINPNTIADDINRPESLPYGLIDFTLRVEPGSTVEVNFVLPSATSENVTWWKYVNGSGWIDFSANTTLNAARDVLTVTLTDNEFGDDDPTLGVIRDPGGLVQIPEPMPGPTPAPPIEESSVSSGGSGGGSLSPLLIALLLLTNYVRIIARSRSTI